MNPTNAPPAPAGTAAKLAASVIRKVEAAEESAHDRLVKKHVPSWVISGAVHVAVIALMILIFGVRTPPVSAEIPAIAATPEKEPDPPKDFQPERGYLFRRGETRFHHVDQCV